jgi:hypothetical protein
VGSPTVLGMEAFYSVLRYTPDPARNEARNIALLVVGEGHRLFFRTAPLSQVTRRLHEQGLLDALLARFEARAKNGELSSPVTVADIASSLNGPIELTSPKPLAVVGSFQGSADALFRTLVAVRQRRGPGLPKGEALDHVVDVFRSRGADIVRGSYIGDFIFDAVVSPRAPAPLAVGVASFDTDAEDWTSTERQVGHYLFAVSKVRPDPAYVVKPPTALSKGGAHKSHERAIRWLEEGGVKVVPYADVPAFAAEKSGGQLWLRDYAVAGN